MALQWYKYEGLLKNLKYCTIWLYFTLLVKRYKHFNVLKTQGTEIRVAVRIFLLYAMVLNITDVISKLGQIIWLGKFSE